MIPLATTTITVTGKRPQSSVDRNTEGYDDVPHEPDYVLAAGVRACITKPRSNRGIETADEVDDYTLLCDPFEGGLTRYDTVTDDTTGYVYAVYTSAESVVTTFGLGHIRATLRVREGLDDVPTAS